MIKHEHLRALLQNMSGSEILKMVTADKYLEIKKKDDKPEFRVYAVGHEGEARGNLIGEGQTKQNWFKDTVGKIADKIKEGIKFFHMHKAGTNGTENRTPLGEVVGKGLKEISGKLYALVVAYIYPQNRSLPLDVASIEANIEYDRNGDNVAIKDVVDITGIALGNSAVVSPAFPGATLLGCLQAFAMESAEGGKEMTNEELVKAVKEAKLKPADIFGEDDLNGDAVVESIVKKAVRGEYEHRKRTDDAFDKARAEWDKEKSELTGKVKTISVEATKLKIGGTLDELAAARKLDEKQMKFIKKNLPSFEIKEPEKVKDELDSFLDKQIREYDELKSIMTGEEPAKKEDKGVPADKGNPNTEEELTSPEKNDFIPA